MPQPSLFRKVALERLSSPEQLDTLPHAITVPGWIALAALGSVLAAVLLWSWFGEIPATGASDCVTDVRSAAGGRVVQVLVKEGDQVSAGQAIARVAHSGQPVRDDARRQAGQGSAECGAERQRPLALVLPALRRD